MMRSLIVLVLAALSHPATAQDDRAEVTSTVYVTTDYRFRGISNSNGPAIQGSSELILAGFYFGLWGSNTEFSDANLEIDYSVGYRYASSKLTIDASGLYYHYPGEHEHTCDELDPFMGQEADYLELHAGVSYRLDLAASPTIGVQYYWSPDFFGEDSDAHYVEGNASVSLPRGLGAYAILGYQHVEGDRTSGMLGGYRYAWWQLGTTVAVKGIKLDLAYVDVQRSATLKAVYAPTMLPAGRVADFSKLITRTILFTVSRTF